MPRIVGWVEAAFDEGDFGDRRRRERVLQTVSTLAWDSGASVGEASADLSVHSGELVEIDGVGEARYVDDGEVSQLPWIDQVSGVEIVITSGEGDERQPLEEMIRIAEGME